MRLFAALRLSAEALEHAAAAVSTVRASCPGPRWIPPERWHLTLAFYGEVDNVERMTRRLDKALRTSVALELALSGSGRFARRAVWLGVIGDTVALRSLAGALAHDAHPYRPHLTVARLRDDDDGRTAVAALSSYAGPSWQADTVHLVRSTLGPRPSYDDIASWTLGRRS